MEIVECGGEETNPHTSEAISTASSWVLSFDPRVNRLHCEPDMIMKGSDELNW